MRLLALVQLLVLHHYRACCGGQDAPLVSILTLANGQTWCNRNALLLSLIHISEPTRPY